MNKRSITVKILVFLSLFISTSLHAAEPILEQLAAMWNKNVPQVTSEGESEIYKVEAENDTLVYYLRLYAMKSMLDLNNKEVLNILYNDLRTKYCATPDDIYRNNDFKWKQIYVDIDYQYLFSFKVSKRDC